MKHLDLGDPQSTYSSKEKKKKTEKEIPFWKDIIEWKN